MIQLSIPYRCIHCFYEYIHIYKSSTDPEVNLIRTVPWISPSLDSSFCSTTVKKIHRIINDTVT